MKAENTNIKTKHPKKRKIPASMVCEICDCSVDLVRKGRRGELTGGGKLSERIAVAEIILPEKMNLLIEEVKRIVNF
jgi:hypothetical protein